MNTDPTYPTDLITSYFAGEASADDLRFLEEWLKADPEHREIFQSYRKTWTSLEKERLGSQLNTDAGWMKLKEKTDRSSASPVRQTGNRTGIIPLFSKQAFRLAAVLIILIVPAVFLYFYLSRPVTKTFTATTACLERKLPDGTTVTLNAGSTIKWPSRFKGRERNVTLSGEAFFEVEHNASKPFIISAGMVRVEDVGTSFYVNTGAGNGTAEVVVSSGKVAVYYDSNKTGQVLLGPGEKAEISAAESTITKSENDDPNYLSWKTYRILFTNDPLDAVVTELNKVYHTRIRITNPALSRCRLTATFDNQTLLSVLNVVSATLNVRVTRNGEWTEISGNTCN